jgi:hypothetical protein
MLRGWLAVLSYAAALFGIATACAAVNQTGFQTQTALDVQATMIAVQSGGAVQPTVVRQGAVMTVQAQSINLQKTELAARSLQLTHLVSTLTAYPSPAPTDTPTPQISPTPAPPTQTPKPTVDLSAALKNAHVLLYEDMAGVYDTSRYIKKALDDMEQAYTDTGDMQGQFKKYLTSRAPDGQDWDLIISANESRHTGNAIKGEFFKYFSDHLQRGAAVIIETWNLDSFYQDPSTHELLKSCGVEYQGDLFDMQFQSEVFYTLIPNHPLLTTPNQISLNYVTNYWNLKGDMGDVLRNTSMGDAALVLGRRPENPDRYGTLAVCKKGRLIIQTFSTHEYRQDDIEKLWQNYVSNALKNRFTQ